MVRAKFKVTEIRQHAWHPSLRTLVLEAQYDSTIAEDGRFAKATPSARLEMQVDNPPALAALPLGSVHYVDFTPAE
jgi:hypothetical protein